MSQPPNEPPPKEKPPTSKAGPAPRSGHAAKKKKAPEPRPIHDGAQSRPSTAQQQHVAPSARDIAAQVAEAEMPAAAEEMPNLDDLLGVESAAGDGETSDAEASDAEVEAATPAPAQNLHMAGYDADVVGGGQRDLLDITLDVNALAALVAARAVTPPLSIGLFGDWGAGKTFFMDQMHDQVERINQSENEEFCEEIVQIRFNAWHYVEANLWASLIDTIFRRLEEAVLGEKDGDAQLEALRRKWQSALHRQRKAERELDELAESLRLAEAERDRILREKEEAEARANDARESGRLKLPSVADISEELGRQLGPLAKRAGREFGMTELSEAGELAKKPVDEAVAALADLRATAGRASHLWRAFACSGITLKQIIIGIIALGAPVAVIAVLAHLNGEAIREWLAQPLAVLAELAAMAGTLVQWVRGRIRRANQLLDRLEKIRKDLTRARDRELEKRRKELEQAQEAVDALALELDDKVTEVDELLARQEDARRELDEFTPARRMATFLSERVQSDDYRKHLGLIALIRQDLSRLSELLAMQSKGERDEMLPGIQRIVLYVDDLDRCPPKRVVELLQAIHLLLAFPLFVVVVAVDARWVSRALVKYYPELLRADPEGSEKQATSHDYLEKIFQIPFWIRPMTPADGARMISGLLQRDEERRDEGRAPAPAAAEVPEVPVFDATRLDIKADEKQCMVELAAIAGRSPRAVKRFINVYRLVKAGLSPDEMAAFEPDSRGGGSYRVTLLTLAVIIGYPLIAEDFFEELQHHTGRLSAFARTIEKKYSDGPSGRDWRELMDKLQKFCKKHSISAAEMSECIDLVARYSFRVTPR